MATDPTPGSTPPRAHPLQRDIRSPGAWQYLVNYILLGACAILIVREMIESGAYRKLAAPLILLGLAVGNLARLQAAERKPAEPGAAPS